MKDRPSRKCESRFRRDIDTDTRSKRRSLGREQVVAERRKVNVNILQTPSATKIAPISFTPNPTLTPRVPRISISPFVAQDAPSDDRTDWDPSPVVGRVRAPSTPNPLSPVLWHLSDDEEKITDVPDLIPPVDSDNEEDEEEVGLNPLVDANPDVDDQLEVVPQIFVTGDQDNTDEAEENPPPLLYEMELDDQGCVASKTSIANPVSTILNAECGSGLRKDCMNNLTCIFRHIGEYPGKPVVLYTKDLPKAKPKVIQCQHCIKTFKSNHGLNIHVKRMHAGNVIPPTNVNPPTIVSAEVNTKGELNSSEHAESAHIMWGKYDIEEFSKNLDIVYDKIVFMRRNLFKLPSGAAGKGYIRETTRLVSAWNSDSHIKEIAWKCIMTMPALLLQKPSASSKAKEHKEVLVRRLDLWKNGDLVALLRECETIQKRMKMSTPSRSIEAISKKFSNLMKAGKVRAAVNLLTANMEGGVLPLNEETMKLLQKKHPEPANICPEAVVNDLPDETHPVIFSTIDGEEIRKAAIKTKGSAGPSGLDADGWRHLLLSKNFRDDNEQLRNALALATRKLATQKEAIRIEKNHPTSNLEAYLACRLVPLDKSPGLRPVGIGEVLRRVMGKTVMSVVKQDVQETTGSIQVCAGQPGGCEAAIHAMKDLFDDDETEIVLLMDASNAFNSINRATMLENVRRLCPAIYIYAYNCYSIHARLFVVGGKQLYSQEGTTQGDPTAMALYGIGTVFCFFFHYIRAGLL